MNLGKPTRTSRPSARAGSRTFHPKWSPGPDTGERPNPGTTAGTPADRSGLH
jgi:hypothetical protein